MAAEELFASFKEKVERLISMYEAERRHSAELSEELLACRSELAAAIDKQKQQEQTIQKQQNKLNNLQLAGAFSDSPQNRAAAKRRLNTVIKEIDECISMLNM